MKAVLLELIRENGAKIAQWALPESAEPFEIRFVVQDNVGYISNSTLIEPYVIIEALGGITLKVTP